MKNKKNIFLIIITCLFLLVAITLHADSGWDGSYDSGGSSSWGSGGENSSWESSGSGSSWSSSGSGNGEITWSTIISVLIVVVAIYFALKSTTKNKLPKNVREKMDEVLYEREYNENNIKQILPDYDKKEFRVKAFNIYKNIQIAWMNFDYDTLQKYTTNELYNLYKSELIVLKTKKQQNIMKDFELNNFSVDDMEVGKDEISIKVKMKITCKDYVVNKYQKVVRGNKKDVIYDYEMTFTKGLNKNNNKCPNCKAPLENNITSTCPYCNSVVISFNHDWVLSKKRVIYQVRR